MTDDLGKALQAAAERWRADLRSALGVSGAVAGASGDVLAHLGTETPQSALTARLGLSKQAVQQSLDQLEAGLVRREPDPADRRARRIVLTAAGQVALERRHAAQRALADHYRDKLGKKLYARLEKALKRLVKG
jgi:DNA-binding MarR family transcriptional regulator